MVLEEMEKKWKESRSIRGFVNLLDVGGEERSQHDDSQVGGLYKRLKAVPVSLQGERGEAQVWPWWVGA